MEQDFTDIAFCHNCELYDRKTKKCYSRNEEKRKPTEHCNFFKTRSYDEILTKEYQTISIQDYKKKEYVEKKHPFTITGLKIDNYIDNVEQFHTINPFFYDQTQIFWLWNKKEYCYQKIDEIDLMNMIDQELGFLGQTVTNSVKGNYLEAFKRVGRKHKPKNIPKTWVQFKDEIYDLISEQKIVAGPEYFTVNPIPWSMGTNGFTPKIDKLFSDWQGENKEVLYEIIAYCCLTDYPIHTIIANIGSGRNGKTQYEKILTKFLGSENVTSSELDTLIDNRFESAKLYKKLVCIMGETNFGTIDKTSLLKKLSGGSLIGYEFKNKMPFTDYNYAKIIISTNSLPASTDTTEGFYRRWMIIHWNNNFEEGKDIVDIIPDSEYEELAFKVFDVLKNLVDRGKFSFQGSIEDRKQKYIMASNPLTLFFEECCDIGDKFFVKAKDLYHSYVQYLSKNKKRIIKRKEFNQLLSEEGFQPEHCDKKVLKNTGEFDFEKSYWIDGIKLKSPISPILNEENQGKNTVIPPKSLILPSFTISSYIRETKGKTRGEVGELGEKSNFELLTEFLLGKVNNEEETEIIIKNGFDEEEIKKWIIEGSIFEPKPGRIRLL